MKRSRELSLTEAVDTKPRRHAHQTRKEERAHLRAIEIWIWQGSNDIQVVVHDVGLVMASLVGNGFELLIKTQLLKRGQDVGR